MIPFPLLPDADGVRRARIAGMMCGTSVDSIDVAVCDIRQLPDTPRFHVDLVGFHEVPVALRLRNRIFRLFENGDGSLSLATSLNTEVAEAFALAFHEALHVLNIPLSTVDALASHGQTVWHIAPNLADTDHVPATLQIGDPCVLAHHARVPVVANFRTADMAAGGNGAPLVPFADWHVFGQPGKATMLLNIGGIANVTLLPASDRLEDVVAFDTGPGNMIIDALVSHFTQGREAFDCDGRMAANGEIIEPLLTRWMAEPYIALPYPKSTGRELFGVQYTRRFLAEYDDAEPRDLVATATLFTARSVAENLSQWLAQNHDDSPVLAVAGGGALNPILMRLLEHEMERVAGRPVRVCRCEDILPFTAKARECVAFSLLGFATLAGIPGNVPSATGAQCHKILGCIAHP